MKETIDNAGHPARGRDEVARFERSYAAAFGRDPDWGRCPTLLRIFGNSRIRSDRLAANPGWFDEISDSQGSRSRERLAAELAEELSGCENQQSFDAAARKFKYREMTRLVATDLAGEGQAREILSEWSDAADILIDAAYRRAHAAVAARFGPPRLPDGSPCEGSVIALGKLGGRELNLSSDVDLLFIYSSDDGGALSPSGSEITNHEWFVKLAAAATRLLTAVTGDGFLYRVDHELRPEGPQGPLANSLDAALRYYEYFGRDWERQAMIRARPCAGSISLGEALVDGLRPFVYRRTMGLSDLAHMREMKGRMAEEAAKHSPSFDVKHGTGGIREAEFLVQAIQVLHGGQAPALRKTNTFEAIDALSSAHLLHPHGAALLSRSYSFLRKLENMIQCEDDAQTHRFPADAEAARALARRMGFSEASELEAETLRHTRGVARLFGAIFEADYERQELEDALEDNLSRADDEEEAADSLAWFRQSEARRLAALDLEGAMPLPRLLRRLTLVAEVVAGCAWRIAMRRLVARHGNPMLDGGERASFAIVGMGRLGSGELDYGSDLDLIFLYSGAGQTDGEKSISNVEFFTKLAQRIISIISLPTRYGRAYLVDSELRPSGRSGTLVATLSSFTEYHSGNAATWERLALLRARAIAGDRGFADEVSRVIGQKAYSSPPPAEELRTEVMRLREKTVDERAREGGGAQNVKLGRGSAADLESAIQVLHLENAHACEGLRRQNTFEVIRALASEGIVDGRTAEEWTDHLSLFRLLIARMRLLAGGSTDVFDPAAPFAEALALGLGFASAADLSGEIARRRAEVRRIYEGVVASQ